MFSKEGGYVVKRYIFWSLCLVLVIITGCSNKAEEAEAVKPEIEIPPNEIESEESISKIMTTDKKIALTFNGMADEETMTSLLERLNQLQIHATFFVQGVKIAEEPEIAEMILENGHTIQNNTLNHILVEPIDYEEAYTELYLTNKVIQENLDITPQFARSRSGDTSPFFESAAAQLDMQVVTNTINPRDGDMQSAEEIAEYVRGFMNRGAIIQLNTYLNPEIIDAVSLIKKDAEEAGYELTTLEAVVESAYTNPNKEIETNKLAVNQDYDQASPQVIENFQTDEQEVVLTFDDWAGDETLSIILDILDDYQIKATFFVIGKGVEANPQLARLIIDRGHEVASHSYNHLVVTEMNSLELQEDLVKADQVISNALQEKPKNYFRPAQGLLDDSSANTIAATGIDYIVLYDIASLDWDLNRSEDEIYKRVVDNVESGSIIGMHISDESHTIRVLPRIIENILMRGYTFKTVSEMIGD